MNADRKAGVFAYYFYRLLHHAKRVDYVYTTVGSENKLKEKSRFIRQIETEFKELKNTDKQINYKNLTAVKTLRGNQREYYFDINEMKFINNGTSTLSPSALNNLIHCQQKFYLNNVRFLREEIEDDKYLAIAFGNIFHNCANIFYQTLKNRNVNEEEVEQIIESVVNDYIQKEDNAKEKRVCGDKVHLNMIKKYIKDVWLRDRDEKIEYLCSEEKYTYDFKTANYTVHFSGRLDRMDYVMEKDGSKVLRIVDYKTGKAKIRNFEKIEDLFIVPDDTLVRSDGFENIFEILFYCYLVYNNKDVKRIKPELMYLTHPNERNITMADARQHNKQTFYYDETANARFENCLKQLLDSLLLKKQNEKYEAVMGEEKCKYCDYKLLCLMGNIQN